MNKTIFGDFCGGYTIAIPNNYGLEGQILTTNGVNGTYWQTVTSGTGGTVTSVSASSDNAFITVTGVPFTVAGSIDLAIGTLSTANGGTGLNTVGSAGKVLTSNGTTLSWQTPSAPGTGTVTSVALSVPSFMSVSGSPITSSGTLAITASSTGSGSVVLATSPTIANLNTSTIVFASNTTLQSNASSPITLTLPPNTGSSGQVLTTNGSGVMTWTTPSAPGTGTVTSVSASVPAFLSISGSPITSSGTLAITYSGTALPIVNGGTGATSATGTGITVLSNSPNITTPFFLTRAASGGDFAAAGNAFIATQGAHLQWNRTGTDGATWVVNQKGGGTGGVYFGESDTSNNFTETLSATTFATYIPARIILAGNTTLQSAAPSPITLTLPPNTGSSGQVLTTNGSGTMTWTTPSAPGTGTVTSVAASVPAFLSISGSPITSSGTLAITYSGTALPIANGGTGATSATGTGITVLSSSPSITTPYFITRAVSSGDLVASDTTPITSQGAYLQWNRTGSDGATWILNEKGGGVGGIYFREATTSNTSTALGDINASRLYVPSYVLSPTFEASRVSPQLTLTETTGGFSSLIGLASFDDSFITGSIAGEIVIRPVSTAKATIISGRSDDQDYVQFCRAGTASIVVTKSNPELYLGRIGGGNCVFGVVGTTGQYFSGPSGTTSVGDTAIKSSASLYIGAPGNQLRLYGANWYFNDVLQSSFTAYNYIRHEFQNGQSIDGSTTATFAFQSAQQYISGTALTYNNTSGFITNQTGRTVIVSAQYTATRNYSTTSLDQYWIFTDQVYNNGADRSYRYGWQRVAGGDNTTGSGTFPLENNKSFGVRVRNGVPNGTFSSYNEVENGGEGNGSYFTVTYSWVYQ